MEQRERDKKKKGNKQQMPKGNDTYLKFLCRAGTDFR